MTLFDDNPLNPADQDSKLRHSTEESSASSSAEPCSPSLAGDPISYAALSPALSSKSYFPEDLRISWSWPHLLAFLFFGLISQIAVGFVVVAYYSANHHFTRKQLEKLVESDPQFLVTTTLLWAAFILLFLYVTLGVLRGLPFWRSLGWKKLSSDPVQAKGRPWMYFVAGCGLYIFVAIAGSGVKDAEHAPIQEFLKNRNGAILLMGMAVFVAPLFEETLFRGYLYPVLARIISAVARFFGMESSSAVRTGVATSILITGILFGLLHGAQLGWAWGLVSLLILVGVIFTFARAWTGTVLASFLLHLGYNSMIAVTSIIATKGFTHMPLHP